VADILLSNKPAQGLVVSLDRGYPLVRLLSVDAAGQNEVRAQHSTELIKNADIRATVGDFVELTLAPELETPLISAIQPRRSALTRKTMVQSIHEGAGRFEEQVLAANIDVVFVVSALGKRALDPDYLERQLVMAYQSGVDVALILTKADQALRLEEDIALARQVAPRCSIVVESAVTGLGFTEITEALTKDGTNKTGVLLGRSGVGKSTLINTLLDAPLLKTGAVRTKDRGGRHTTVARRLVTLPHGGALIDTPGLRSLGLYEAHEGLSQTFLDVEALAENCHYRNCTHTNEPDCSVKDAVLAGSLDARRLSSYQAIYQEVVD
jgi:ribosome biogenesis GTPase